MNRFHAAIVSRLKIMAKMNIAEKRVPQDGRIKLRVAGREVDIRVSIIPMLHGEGIVMRVLDKERIRFSLQDIGMPQDVYDRFQQLIRLPHGIVLVTGPDRFGKDDDAVQRIERDQERRHEDHHDGRSDRVSAGRDQSDPGASQGRTDLCRQSAEHPAARSGRRPGRRDPRLGNGRECHSGVADRPPGLQHAAHQRLGRGIHAAVRHGGRAVPGQQHGRGRDGAATGSDVVPALPPGVCTVRADDLPADFPYEQLRAATADVSTTPSAVANAAERATPAAWGSTNCWCRMTRFATWLASVRPSNVVKRAAIAAGMRTLRMDGWEKGLPRADHHRRSAPRDEGRLIAATHRPCPNSLTQLEDSTDRT